MYIYIYICIYIYMCVCMCDVIFSIYFQTKPEILPPEYNFLKPKETHTYSRNSVVTHLKLHVNISDFSGYKCEFELTKNRICEKVYRVRFEGQYLSESISVRLPLYNLAFVFTYASLRIRIHCVQKKFAHCSYFMFCCVFLWYLYVSLGASRTTL